MNNFQNNRNKKKMNQWNQLSFPIILITLKCKVVNLQWRIKFTMKIKKKKYKLVKPIVFYLPIYDIHWNSEIKMENKNKNKRR